MLEPPRHGFTVQLPRGRPSSRHRGFCGVPTVDCRDGELFQVRAGQSPRVPVLWGVRRALAPAPRPADEERKVVTVLFCDLVGFTARSDRPTPRTSGPCCGPITSGCAGRSNGLEAPRQVHRRCGHGGFGAPAAHEDDPSGPRCAARLLEAIVELNSTQPALALSVRIGITTGEALVVLQPGGRPRGWLATSSIPPLACRGWRR